MIRVRLLATSLEDVCELVERHLNCDDIADWIAEKATNISFDCMDFPYDMNECYDCYFQCQDDHAAAQEVYALLKESLIERQEVKIEVCIVDEKLNVTATV